MSGQRDFAGCLRSRTEGGETLGEIDPTGRREEALHAFLQAKRREGFEIETHTPTHAIIARRKSFLRRLRGGGSTDRFVISVDEHGEVTTSRAEPKRS